MQFVRADWWVVLVECEIGQIAGFILVVIYLARSMMLKSLFSIQELRFFLFA